MQQVASFGQKRHVQKRQDFQRRHDICLCCLSCFLDVFFYQELPISLLCSGSKNQLLMNFSYFKSFGFRTIMTIFDHKYVHTVHSLIKLKYEQTTQIYVLKYVFQHYEYNLFLSYFLKHMTLPCCSRCLPKLLRILCTKWRILRMKKIRDGEIFYIHFLIFQAAHHRKVVIYYYRQLKTNKRLEKYPFTPA